ncbi:hypothetical protein MPL3356_300203 [Mesorhizobium plurifarium]|uniref:Uncharacterized protein n=1 Tax=Mesorhizobium plurifarium TaxID=69974 RepID=A0A090DT10_MESPL|nr:hypothetical protein MPL3356_300203 [Mesorhizobium plurifarium]
MFPAQQRTTSFRRALGITPDQACARRTEMIESYETETLSPRPLDLQARSRSHQICVRG